MTRYAIDAPTLLALATGGDAPGEHRLVAAKDVVSRALELVLAEVRAGRIDERTALEHHEALTTVKVRLLGDRVSRRLAFRLAREHDWPTLTHAETLAIARLQADALVTVDPELAALAEGVVTLGAFGDLLA